MSIAFKVTVNVFWVKISIFQFFHILLAELSRHTMIPCLKPTEALKPYTQQLLNGDENLHDDVNRNILELTLQLIQETGRSD